MDGVIYMVDDEDDEDDEDMETRYYEIRAIVKIEAMIPDRDSTLVSSIKDALFGEHDCVIQDEEAVFEIESISIKRK